MVVEIYKRNLQTRFGKLSWEQPAQKAEPARIL